MRRKEMMQRTWCTLALLAISLLAATAQQTTREQAIRRAAEFMGSSVTKEKLVKVQLTNEVAKGPGGTEETIQAFNVKGGGFVIVAGNAGGAQTVIGYSDSGTLDADHMPVAMKGIIDRFRQHMVRYGQRISPSRDGRPYKNYRCNIKPLIQTQWGQGTPYNDLCPTLNGERCITGCVATAAAQLMYYFKWPLTESEVIPAYVTRDNQLSIGDLPPRRFDWNKMLTKYQNATPEQNRAIAELMQYCGSSVNMNYGINGSSASMSNIEPALNRFFHYTSKAHTEYRSSYSNDDWEDLIYNELAEGRPVIYSGTKDDGGGHCFLVDGYDKRGLFHFNWGWGGLDDGWFRLTLDDTNDNDISYSDFHYAVLGVQRPMRMWRQTITAEQNISVLGLGVPHSTVKPLPGKKVFAPIQVTCQLQNTEVPDCVADIALGLYQGDKLLDVFPVNAQKIRKGTKFKRQIVVNRIYTDLPAGNYILRVVCKETKRYRWFPVHDANAHAYSLQLSSQELKIRKYTP